MKNLQISFSDAISTEPVDGFCANLHRNIVGPRPTHDLIWVTSA